MFKSFSLHEDKNKILSICSEAEQQKRSHFEKGDLYIDYESLEKEIAPRAITATLLDLGYLRLETEQEV